MLNYFELLAYEIVVIVNAFTSLFYLKAYQNSVKLFIQNLFPCVENVVRKNSTVNNRSRVWMVRSSQFTTTIDK